MSVEPLLYLARDEVAELLPPVDDQLDLVERTYRAVGAGDVELPPKPGVHPRKDAFIHAMPAYLRGEDVAALKWVGGYPENKARGLPYISGLIVVNDAETGLPSAVMDAAEITAARTAAASGVCVRRWARAGWRAAAILGAGEQGRFHGRLLRELNPDAELRAYDPHPERAAELARDVAVAGDPREAIAGADVVVSAAPIVEDPDPPIGPDWLGPDTLALPIDFDAYFRADAIEAADLFLVDDVEQFEYYRSLGHFRSWPEPAAGVGDALERGLDGRRVACCNLGIGALDAAFAAEVFQAARERGLGTALPR